VSNREKEVLETAIKILKDRLNPPRILLFGSRAEGRARKESDFDLAVEGPLPDFRKRWEIAEAIDDAIGLYEVDIVYLESVEEPFRRLIKKTGKAVYEREEKRSAA
jgi:predicted nucleotidyltransferase